MLGYGQDTAKDHCGGTPGPTASGGGRRPGCGRWRLGEGGGVSKELIPRPHLLHVFKTTH